MITVTAEYLRSQGLSPTIVERFWAHVNQPKDPASGCWLWDACCSCGFYGMISNWPNGTIRTHVLSYILHFGKVPEGKQVCHICDVHRCVRPDHLIALTWEENMQDKVNKGRQNRSVPWSVGMLNANSKVTEEMVRIIRKLYSPGIVTLESIANRFGIDRTQVSNIVRRRQWKHVVD